ncbi:MAG: hypothetical protein K5860_10600 [Bacteroidales bacterium]|nr:hypothetical protein [Bacteroidales bacterium]
MEVVITYDNPRNADEWNALCKECGNFVQTTMYSEITAFYGGKSIYIQVFDNHNLVGGVKIGCNVSRRLPFLSKILSQFGEFVVKPENDIQEVVCQLLCDEISSLSDKIKPTVISVKGFYGGKSLLYKTDKYKCDEKNYGVAYLDLEQSEDDLLKNIDRNHRRSIKKAENANLEFIMSHNPQYVIEMLQETYAEQSKTGPNPKYVETEINLGAKYGVSYVGVTKCCGDVLSANEAVLYGDVAYLTLGGNKKNKYGAGAFEHWNVIKELKRLGCKKFTFGQVARNDSFGDEHFVDGITDFKMKFGCYVVDTCNREFIIKPFNTWVWKMLCKTFIK